MIMTAYTNLGKVSSEKHNRGRKLKFNDRNRRVMKRIIARNHKTTLPQITSKMNTHLLNPVRNAAKRLQWCRDHLNWTELQWEQVIWSDESSFTLFQTSGHVFVWRTPTEAIHVDCLVPTVKHGEESVMVWAAISFRGLGPLVVLRGMITGDPYQSILEDHLHPMLQTLFPGERPVFQDDNAPVHTSRWVQTWLHEHVDEVEYLIWCPQSPDLNIIQHLWGYLENKVRARFPPPRTLFEVETVLHEECVQIPMNFVQGLYFSIPR
ncbi:transposable element Tcb1 transposase [Trichonephila clavipes]|uniref:Transposable element Tcb1 transposase n=1 Tax=Trichonephila clavipes TaxID=2585209 RepID=A0A8X6V116_TRICX|nr:transposable element Tcb1 transposase [Trichonephila clavipes]